MERFGELREAPSRCWVGALLAGFAVLGLLGSAPGPVGAQETEEQEAAQLADTLVEAALVNVEGEVLDAVTGVPVGGAIVVVPMLGRTTFSDELGYFRMDSVPVGAYAVQVIRLGYETMDATVPLIGGEMLVVRLDVGAIPLDAFEVTVIGGSELEWRSAGSQTGLIGPVEMEELAEQYMQMDQVFASRRISGTRYVFSRALGQPGCLRSARGADTWRAPSRSLPGAAPGMLDCAAVVVDGVLLNPETSGWVYELDPDDVFAIRFLNASDAAARYGHTGRDGVLVVETRAGRWPRG